MKRDTCITIEKFEEHVPSRWNQIKLTAQAVSKHMVIDSSQRAFARKQEGRNNDSKKKKLEKENFYVNEKILYTVNSKIFEPKWRKRRGAYFSFALSISRDSLTAYKLRAIFRNF